MFEVYFTYRSKKGGGIKKKKSNERERDAEKNRGGRDVARSRTMESQKLQKNEHNDHHRYDTNLSQRCFVAIKGRIYTSDA